MALVSRRSGSGARGFEGACDSAPFATIERAEDLVKVSGLDYGGVNLKFKIGPPAKGSSGDNFEISGDNRKRRNR